MSSSETSPPLVIAAPAHYAYIDALRGIAIFGVMAMHTGMEIGNFPGGDVTGLGNYGVQLFYVVSAFSLMLSLSHRAKKNEPELLHHYFIRRFMRIAPMFYVAIGLWLAFRAIDPFGKHSAQPSGPQVATAMLFVNGWIPGHINAVLPGAWSVAIETSFYVLLPLLFRFIKSLRVAIVASVVMWGAGAGLSAALPRIFPGVPQPLMSGFKFYWLPAQLGVFLLGIVLFFLHQEFRKKLPKHVTASTLLIFSVIVFFVAAYMPQLPSRHYFVSYAFVGLALSLSLRPIPLFVNRFWGLLGRVSFSAYLLHVMVVQGAYWGLARFLKPTDRPLVSFLILFPVVVVVSMAVAWVTYRLIELPGQAAGKWIIARMTPRRAAVAAGA